MTYHQGWRYLFNRYFLAPRILRTGRVLERPVNQEDLSMHILTCHRDLVMLAWSLASFYRYSAVIGRLYLHDDGSLTAADKAIIRSLFPAAVIVGGAELLAGEKTNGFNSQPEIKKFRLDYQKVFVRKIIDSFFVSEKKFHLIFDSDVLWFGNPREIFNEISSANPRSLMLQGDGSGCYVVFKDGTLLAEELSNFNSGLVFYAKDNFNLSRLAVYAGRLNLEDERSRYFGEQAGFAYSLDNLEPLPKDKYFMKGDLSSATAAKHYTSPRRPLFYIEGLEKLKNIL